ncbi:hypothetical protein GQF61_00405 [Sphingobacterium sp. DK4209]|uniref:HPt domain-containing protein n=1 Tax=Sphingobacterium zhuxiongii TaxID=2662364 RepID=A0A5Q0Q948_9SPHI|nr:MULTISPECIES: Hpt domain-containing protein [unclassified Sphingobacterium]MVZ64300.1 hypothetical protein [Sphingobacterium sp. DK4209]QGA25649.1 hypothetical protein GFH32_04630 [Sphingobacterium sp. dk4302]
MSKFKIINPEVLKSSMMNNMEMVKQLINLYLTQGKVDFETLQSAVEARDLQEVASKSHHIKPTMEYIGATDLRILFQELEQKAKKNEPSDVIEETFSRLKKDFDTAMIELEAYSTSLVDA